MLEKICTNEELLTTFLFCLKSKLIILIIKNKINKQKFNNKPIGKIYHRISHVIRDIIRVNNRILKVKRHLKYFSKRK